MSGTPHMSGQQATASEPDDQLDTSDLLDADGEVDVSKIHSVANAGAHRDDRLSASDADEIRERILDGESIPTVAADLGRSRAAVRDHVRGAVEYARGESPEHRPLEFVDGEWRLAVVFVTRHGRVYHTDPDCVDIMRDARRRDRSEAEAWGLRECRHCAEGPSGGNPDKTMVMRLREADPADVAPTEFDREREGGPADD